MLAVCFKPVEGINAVMLRINAKDIGHREAFSKMLMAPLKPVHLELERPREHELA